MGEGGEQVVGGVVVGGVQECDGGRVLVGEVVVGEGGQGVTGTPAATIAASSASIRSERGG